MRDFQKHRTLIACLDDIEGVVVAFDQKGIDNEGGSLVNGDDDRRDEALRRQWADEVVEPVRRAGLTPPRLDIIHSPYRKFLDPLLAHVEKVKAEFPRRQVAVVVPEVVKRHWWQFLLHQYRAERLRSALLGSGDKRTVLINVPCSHGA